MKKESSRITNKKAKLWGIILTDIAGIVACFLLVYVCVTKNNYLVPGVLSGVILITVLITHLIYTIFGLINLKKEN